MKRYLSIALILGMMLSLLGIIPAQAEEAAAYPYMNLSFDTEGDTSAVSSGGAYNVAWSEEGVAGSVGSLYFAMTGNSGDYYMPITCPEILIGQKAKISCWIKIDTARTKVKRDDVKIILWGKTPTTTNNNTYQYNWNTVPSKSFNSGEWVKVEYIVDNWDGSMDDGDKLNVNETVIMTPRVGGLGPGGTKEEAVAADSPENVLAFWMDEVRVEPVPETTSAEPPTELLPPAVTGVSADSTMIVGDEVRLNWTFNSPNGATDEYTLVRMVQVMDNGEEATIAIAPSRVFNIPENTHGKKLRFDILPCEKISGEEESYLFGDFVSLALSQKVKAAKIITPTLSEIGTDVVTGTLYVENNAGDPVELFMLVAVYDENDCAIRYDTRTLSVAVGFSDNISFSVSTVEAEGFAPVKCAKAFVWGGTGVFDTDLTPYTDVLVVEKN